MALSDFQDDYTTRQAGLQAWLNGAGNATPDVSAYPGQSAPLTPAQSALQQYAAAKSAGFDTSDVNPDQTQSVDLSAIEPNQKAAALAQESFSPGTQNAIAPVSKSSPSQPWYNTAVGSVLTSVFPRGFGAVAESQKGQALIDHWKEQAQQNPLMQPIADAAEQAGPQNARQYIPQAMDIQNKLVGMKMQKSALQQLQNVGGYTGQESPDTQTQPIDIKGVPQQGASGIPPIAAVTPGQASNITNNAIVSGPANEKGIVTPPQEDNITSNGTVGGAPLSGKMNTALSDWNNSQNALPTTATPEAQAAAVTGPQTQQEIQKLQTQVQTKQAKLDAAKAKFYSNPSVINMQAMGQGAAVDAEWARRVGSQPEALKAQSDAIATAAAKMVGENGQLTSEEKNSGAGVSPLVTVKNPDGSESQMTSRQANQMAQGGGAGGIKGPLPGVVEGAQEAQKNYQTYRQGLSTQASNLGKEVQIANAQDDFMKFTNGRGGFKPGLGEEHLAQAAAAAAAAGASPATQAMIARGDPGAVQAFTALASQESVRQMEGMMASGGASNPRITQSMFENFKADLSNPNKQPNAINAIHNMMRLQYKQTVDEQNAALNDKGDPTTFQARYQQQKYPSLMDGRGADPSAAIQSGSVQSQIPPKGAIDTGKTIGGKQVYKLPNGKGWMPD